MSDPRLHSESADLQEFGRTLTLGIDIRRAILYTIYYAARRRQGPARGTHSRTQRKATGLVRIMPRQRGGSARLDTEDCSVLTT